MKVTAIIPSLYEIDKEYLKLCVESLRATTDWDIIVVTNGMPYKPNLEHIKGITVHLHYYEQGQGKAVNAGAQVANSVTDYFFIVNSDMYFAPGWLNDVQGVGWPLVWSPNLVEPVNNAGSAAPFLKLDAGYTLEEFDRKKVDSFVKVHEDNNDEPGFNFPVFIQKDVWKTIGGYDEKYDPWGSNGDTDLQTKVNLAGITPLRIRDNLVYHFSNKSGTFDGTHQEDWQRNWNYFDQKWGFNRDVLGSDVWYNKDMLPSEKEQIKYNPSWMGKYENS
jgi:GT2 family glycosyltransferase